MQQGPSKQVEMTPGSTNQLNLDLEAVDWSNSSWKELLEEQNGATS
jgi:hypothetical protein